MRDRRWDRGPKLLNGMTGVCAGCYEELQRCPCGREYCIDCNPGSTAERCERCEEERAISLAGSLWTS